jgi:hypothetical protein
MKLIVIFLTIFSGFSFAGIPTCGESRVVITGQALPAFKDFKSSYDTGTVTFTISLDRYSQITRSRIISLHPENLPREVIMEMINRSYYRAVSLNSGYSSCGARDFELKMEFDLPSDIEFNFDEFQ